MHPAESFVLLCCLLSISCSINSVYLSLKESPNANPYRQVREPHIQSHVLRSALSNRLPCGQTKRHCTELPRALCSCAEGCRDGLREQQRDPESLAQRRCD